MTSRERAMQSRSQGRYDQAFSAAGLQRRLTAASRTLSLTQGARRPPSGSGLQQREPLQLPLLLLVGG